MPYAFEGGICTEARDGSIEITDAQYEEALGAIIDGKAVSINGGFAIVDAPAAEEPPSDPPTIADYENAIQAIVDGTAKTKLFRDGVTLASYTASTNPVWAAEAQAFVAWRDGVWTYAYAELAKVQAGEREQPTVEQFLTEIAPIAWPVSS
ncbi:hypothetical protein [Agrobacterium tumefaciens]|uniref:Uncharacterized protein n=2 Tax=Agrobacterium tumefaciens TaxID=358 RepID=A0A2L2LI64_AGRTU|nr:hypothetical protein [Agrobacterium tumefaciens]AVH44019.1 hypothetical protein At1D1609_39720 [Agrobacterium tumefaciens]